jgi:hypothetical protein
MRPVHIRRGGRAAPLHWEWHNWSGVRYLMVGIAHPRRHARWAVTATVYLPGWAGRTPLALVPSTGWRSWGDSWAPLCPWMGGSRPWKRGAK